MRLLKAYRKTYPSLGESYIFRTPEGSPLDPDNWYKRSFVPTAERAELRPIGLHTLRHTYASLLKVAPRLSNIGFGSGGRHHRN